MCTHWWLTFTWISCCCWLMLLLKIFQPSVHFLISTFFFFMELDYVPVSNYFFALTNFMMCQTTICDNSFHRPTLLRPYLWRRLIKRTNWAGFKILTLILPTLENTGTRKDLQYTISTFLICLSALSIFMHYANDKLGGWGNE